MASTSASSASAGNSPARTANSRPPMKRAVGTGSPRTSTLASMSALGSSRAVPPTAMMMTQVPVEITVKGSRLDTRCGTSEAFESCAPQMTRTSARKAGRRSDLRLEGSERVPGVAPRREQAPPTELRRPCSMAGPHKGSRDRCARRTRSLPRPRRRSGAMTNIADSPGTLARPQTLSGYRR